MRAMAKESRLSSMKSAMIAMAVQISDATVHELLPYCLTLVKSDCFCINHVRPSRCSFSWIVFAIIYILDENNCKLKDICPLLHMNTQGTGINEAEGGEKKTTKMQKERKETSGQEKKCKGQKM
ncbi:hypothetical protein M440DRAFT_1062349 [Trichoderma longibrachiatum ATCC 18648]|uniref:Uncharacterized protein n=1 Tax=Trichoderma longibrachiatum ATCC 18648 TaxID=983965 RepID=A0A2T4BVT9_TRILO|nr:hypothetical protein M440DRAFT_1062349 [Trichoderma longibrachiatum ATCC 18648]